MEHLKNVNGIGLYSDNGLTVKGPYLHSNMPACTQKELYDFGLITLNEVKLFNKESEQLINMQYNKGVEQ